MPDAPPTDEKRQEQADRLISSRPSMCRHKPAGSERTRPSNMLRRSSRTLRSGRRNGWGDAEYGGARVVDSLPQVSRNRQDALADDVPRGLLLFRVRRVRHVWKVTLAAQVSTPRPSVPEPLETQGQKPSQT